MPEPHTSWVEVNLGALRHNLGEIRRVVGPSVRIMAVVKANAYGHGAVESSKALVEAGADYLGVTTLDEGVELRKAGVEAPVLVFSPLLPDQMPSAISAGLDQTLCDLSLAKAASSAAASLGLVANVHVKVDTGMGRLGVGVDECPAFVESVSSMQALSISGIYTHFANATSADLSHARMQNHRFSALLGDLSSRGLSVGLRHAANSAALLSLPESRYDMVRPGTILYGQYPSRSVPRSLDLQDTWCLKTRIVAVRRLSAGSSIGYGSEYVTSGPMTVAVIPLGYCDGFTLIPESVARRSFSPVRTLVGLLRRRGASPRVTIRGVSAPIVGRVSMQMCSVDVTGVPGVEVGDEVIVPARRTTTSPRIPRICTGGHCPSCETIEAGR